MTEGRKENSTSRFKSLVADVKGSGVSVDWLLIGLEGLDRVTRELDAHNPREIDSFRDSNGRSSSEPGGTYVEKDQVLVFEACISRLPRSRSRK